MIIEPHLNHTTELTIGRKAKTFTIIVQKLLFKIAPETLLLPLISTCPVSLSYKYVVAHIRGKISL